MHQECCYRHKMENLYGDPHYVIILNGQVHRQIICASSIMSIHSLDLLFDSL